MLKKSLKLFLSLLLLFITDTALANSQPPPPASCQTPLLSSKPTMGKVAQLFEGIGWCCGFEAAGRYPNDAAAAVRQMTDCYYINSGIKAILVDLPAGSVHYKGNNKKEDAIWTGMWHDIWGIVLDALMSTPVTSQWYGQLKLLSNQQPNCAYWNGTDSARQCYADFKNGAYEPDPAPAQTAPTANSNPRAEPGKTVTVMTNKNPGGRLTITTYDENGNVVNKEDHAASKPSEAVPLDPNDPNTQKTIDQLCATGCEVHHAGKDTNGNFVGDIVVVPNNSHKRTDWISPSTGAPEECFSTNGGCEKEGDQ